MIFFINKLYFLNYSVLWRPFIVKTTNLNFIFTPSKLFELNISVNELFVNGSKLFQLSSGEALFLVAIFWTGSFFSFLICITSRIKSLFFFIFNLSVLNKAFSMSREILKRLFHNSKKDFKTV